MRRSIFALLGVVGALAAFPAAAQDEVTWSEADACLSDPDVAICWLRLSARADGGRALWRDPELQARAHLLALAGVSDDEPELAYLAAPTPAPELPPALAAYSEAVLQSAEAIRLEHRPDQVIDPLAGLPLTGDVLNPNPFESGASPFGRLDGYAHIALHLATTPSGSPAYIARIMDAVLAAWEADLAGTEEAQVLNGGRMSLAGYYFSRGDTASARRVVRSLLPDNEPLVILALSEMGLLDEAFAVSEAADPARSLARLRREDATHGVLAAREIAAFTEIYRGVMGAEAAPPDPEVRSISEEQALLRRATSELTLARDLLMRTAERAGRSEIALPTAHRVLPSALALSDQMDGGEPAAAALRIIVTAQGEAATPVVERVAAQAEGRRDDVLQYLLPALHEAWIDLGYPDRALAMVDQWRPLAAAQGEAFTAGAPDSAVLGEGGSPGAMHGLQNILIARGDVAGAAALGWLPPGAPIEEDIRTGRGASRIDTYLTGLPPEEQARILHACDRRAHEVGDVQAAVVCARRNGARANTPLDQSVAARSLVRAAAMAANEGDLDLSLRLAREALPIGVAAGTRNGLPPAVPTHSLLDIAKAMLRQDGRLPSRAAGD